MNKGRPAESARSDHSDMDPDEAELDKLQRQQRIMERDHQAYKIQAQREIHKQEQEMEQLLKEQDELHWKLSACKKASRLQPDSKNLQCVQALLQESVMLDEEIKKEKQCQQELQKEISKMEPKVPEVKKGEASESAAEGSEKWRTQKAVTNLQYNLDEALTRFSEQMSTNKHLRQEVRTLHIEHVRFLQLRNRLNKELQEVRKKTAEVTNLSNAAYNARVEVQSKMTMMQENVVKECAQYNTEMKELQRVIAYESNLKGFMSTKCSEKNEGDNDQGMGPRQLSELKEQNSMDALEEMLKRNQIVTEEGDLDLLVARFIQAEDRNFALYNFVTEQNKEAEALRDEISQIREEMEQFQVKGLQQKQDHQSQLRDIEEKLNEIELQAEDYENQGSSISKILDEITTGTNSIFSKLECDRSKAEDLLGFSTGITENNIMFYLGLLEQKTNELLTIQAFLNFKDPEKDYNPKDLVQILLGQNPELLQQSISIQAGVNSVDYDAEESPVSDEEKRPFSHAELRKRIMEAQQKESPARQATKKSLKDQSADY